MSDISREAVESLLPYQLLSYKAMNRDVVKMQDMLRALRDALDQSEAANRALQAEIDRLRLEEDLSEQARKMMADILTRTVNILRGEPEPLKQHSWHDIPDRVLRIINASNAANRGHVYYRAGELDCPKEIKAANGELHTLRCRSCGLDNPRGLCAGSYAGHEPQQGEQP